MNRQAEVTQAMIMAIIKKADRPLNAKEISDRLLGSYGVRISSISIGANLGYMCRAKEVKKCCVLYGMHKIGFNVYPHVLNCWYRGSLPDSFGKEYSRRMRIENEQRYEATKPLEKRRRKRPHTDDMRQMINDLGVGR